MLVIAASHRRERCSRDIYFNASRIRASLFVGNAKLTPRCRLGKFIPRSTRESYFSRRVVHTSGQRTVLSDSTSLLFIFILSLSLSLLFILSFLFLRLFSSSCFPSPSSHTVLPLARAKNFFQTSTTTACVSRHRAFSRTWDLLFVIRRS